MTTKEKAVRDYLDSIERNQRTLTTVQLSKHKFEKTTVIVEKQENNYFLTFKEPEIIRLLEGQSK